MYVSKSAFGSTVYKKHYPPALADEVWRLEKIGKDGSFHKKLNKEGIFIVEDFLRLVVRDQKKLRNVRLLLLFLSFDYLRYHLRFLLSPVPFLKLHFTCSH